jgi:hypothetical protein
VDKVVDSEQLHELMIAIRRLIEGAAPVYGSPDVIMVERTDIDRLNQLAAQVPSWW